jgi:sugar lactone lactonase YvrE
MRLRRLTQLAGAALIVLLPGLASAHLVVDVGVSVRAPAFATRSSSLVYSIDVVDLAYDSAYGVVMSQQLPAGSQFVSAKANGWNCSQSKGTVSCSAETLTPGVSTITVTATAPAATGTIKSSISLMSIGSIDPYSANDTTSAQTVIYDSATCSGAAPSLLGPADGSSVEGGHAALSWSAIAGAAKYRVWSAVEGASPSTLVETADTQVSVDAEAGSTEWWVDAVFDACPPASSPHAHFLSQGRPFALYLSDYAGQPGVSGFDDGALTAAKFTSPASVGVDVYGNMYVADAGASTIRRITPNGTVSTIMGEAGVAGSGDGTGGYGYLDHPKALAVSAGGYIYVADTDNQAIRILYPNGNGIVFGPFLVTLAGSPGMQGDADGTGASARFTAPAGIAVAPDYTLFVGDTGTDRIRQLHLSAVVTSLAGVDGSPGAGDGPAAMAGFHGPTGLAIDTAGNIYVADTENDVIRRLGKDGMVTTIAGTAGQPGFVDGAGSTARFDHPTALALDSLGNLYVADTGNHAIRRIAPSHMVSTVIGTGAPGHRNGAGVTALLNAPSGVAFDSAGRLFIADAGNRVIRMATTTAPPPGPTQPRRRAIAH